MSKTTSTSRRSKSSPAVKAWRTRRARANVRRLAAVKAWKTRRANAQ